MLVNISNEDPVFAEQPSAKVSAPIEPLALLQPGFLYDADEIGVRINASIDMANEFIEREIANDRLQKITLVENDRLTSLYGMNICEAAIPATPKSSKIVVKPTGSPWPTPKRRTNPMSTSASKRLQTASSEMSSNTSSPIRVNLADPRVRTLQDSLAAAKDRHRKLLILHRFSQTNQVDEVESLALKWRGACTKVLAQLQQQLGNCNGKIASRKALLNELGIEAKIIGLETGSSDTDSEPE